MANYSTEQIFTTSREEAPGFSRQRIDFGDSSFAFTTLVPDSMTVWTGDGSEASDEPVALIYEPEERDRFLIEVRRIEFPAFAEAQVAGYGFLGLQGYNRVIQDKDNSNAAFAYLAGGVAEENGSYSRMARLATISRGNEVLFIYATFDYGDFPEFQDVLSRFMGAIKMDEPGTPMDALREMTAAGGERLLIPSDWAVRDADTQDPGRTDFDMTLDGNEYPNITATIRPVSLEEGRKLGAEMIQTYTRQVEESPNAEFAGDAEMKTYQSDTGEPIAYGFARGLITVDGALLISEFYIQTNHDVESMSIIGLNSFDVRRGVDQFPAEIQDQIFKGWVTGSSAYAVLRISLHEGVEYFKNDLDITALGH